MPVFVLPFPAIDPVLISVGPISLRWYALAYVAGILLGWWYALRLIGNSQLWAETVPITKRHADDFIIWLTLGIVLGGRLGYVLFYNFSYFADNPASAFAVWQGGMSFHGGLIGVAVFNLSAQEQMELFPESRNRQLERAREKIDNKFGPGAIRRGNMV